MTFDNLLEAVIKANTSTVPLEFVTVVCANGTFCGSAYS